MPRRAGVAIRTTTYQKFRGADFSTDPALVDSTRSPLCTNMISDGGGMPEKRPGWKTVCSLPGTVYGIFSAVYEGEEHLYIHAGDGLYYWDGESKGCSVQLLGGLNEAKSRGVSLGGSFWIVTGGEFIECRGQGARRVSGCGYIPTTVITREPTGGGVMYESVNMLSPYRRNGFQTDGEAKDFLLDSDSIDTAFQLNQDIADGMALYFTDAGVNWGFSIGGRAGEILQLDFENMTVSTASATAEMVRLPEADGVNIETIATLTEDSKVFAEVWGEEVSGFMVNRAEGIVTFAEAPAAPLAGSADGLTLTFPKTVPGYSDMINHCTIISTYGAGNSDRLVLSGNPDYPNRDWISGFNDPTYFPDLGYSVVGLEDTAIMGYCRIGSALAIVKEDKGNDTTVFFRSYSVDTEGNVSFPLQQAVTGVGAVSRGGFANLLDEPLFVSGTGIYAVSVNNLTGDRAGQNRSFYLNARLTTETISEAEGVSWRGMYLLGFPNGHVYILDGRQAKTYRSESLGDFCYEGWYWENVPALCWLNRERGGVEELFFGTADGRVCRFNSDKGKMDCYSDDGEAIDALWATKLDDDGCATVLKTMIKRGCAVTLKPYSRSSARISFRTDRDPAPWEAVYDTLDICSWENIDFSRFTFDSNDSAREIFFGTKVKKYKRLQIIIRNNAVNEGFGIFAITKNYVEGNYAKR